MVLKDYRIWRKQVPENGTGGFMPWIETEHTVLARSDDEAQSKLRRRFAGAAFTCMRLIALPFGMNPNSISRPS